MMETPVVELDPSISVGITPVIEMGDSPTGMVTAPGDDRHLYILQQNGLIMKFDRIDQKFDPEPFLDLRPEINLLYQQKPNQGKFGDERGLLGLAFHPEFNTIGSLFRGIFVVSHSELANPELYRDIYREKLQKEVPDPDCMTCIASYHVEASAELTKASRKIILCYPKPQNNHNGGGLAFGSDGYLWIGTGDGGGANDEHGPLLNPSDPNSFLGNGQNLHSFHGKLLRIEVVQPMAQQIPYGIPLNNPLVNSDRGYPEIAHWGFRNIWRMFFDPSNPQDLYVADVGQNRFESIKLVNIQQLGSNYLWRGYEGREVFNQAVANYIDQLPELKIWPIITYGRKMGIALVGAGIYRGKRLPALVNKLIIADFSGRISIGVEKEGMWTISTLFKLETYIHSLAFDSENEPYFLSYDGKQKQGFLYRLDPGTSVSQSVSQPINQPIGQMISQLVGQPIGQPVGQSIDQLVDEKLTPDEIQQIIQQAVTKAQSTQSALRVKNGKPTTTRMHIAIILAGQKEAQIVASMDDAWVGSFDIAKRKAYTAYAFSSSQNALTTRTIRALSQLKKGNWNDLRKELTFEDIPLNQFGNSNPIGGIIEFPGGVPLYKNGKLVGGIGVSGDHPDQDEEVAQAGAQAGAAGFEAPVAIRSNTVANLPFYKE